jgi:predicted XRE-type DNA-binding protein
MNTLTNAFELLTDDEKEVENYMLRSNMMDAIIKLINLRGWTQEEVTKNLGVSHLQYDNLKNGRISKLSHFVLEGMLVNLK